MGEAKALLAGLLRPFAAPAEGSPIARRSCATDVDPFAGAGELRAHARARHRDRRARRVARAVAPPAAGDDRRAPHSVAVASPSCTTSRRRARPGPRDAQAKPPVAGASGLRRGRRARQRLPRSSPTPTSRRAVSPPTSPRGSSAGTGVPADARLLQRAAAVFPDCAGVALGFDRLVMLALGADSIDQVIAFPPIAPANSRTPPAGGAPRLSLPCGPRPPSKPLSPGAEALAAPVATVTGPVALAGGGELPATAAPASPASASSPPRWC